MVAQGLELMVYGMGTVLLFLTLLVLATTLMSRAIERFLPVDAPEPASCADRSDPDAHLVAVVSATVHRYRSGRR